MYYNIFRWFVKGRIYANKMISKGFSEIIRPIGAIFGVKV